MRYDTRLNKLEKKSNQGRSESPAKIKVIHSSEEEFEKSYAIFQARKKLGLVKIGESKKIFASADETLEDKYENLTTNQAEKILKELDHET